MRIKEQDLRIAAARRRATSKQAEQVSSAMYDADDFNATFYNLVQDQKGATDQVPKTSPNIITGRSHPRIISQIHRGQL
jgi:hypothetical protein